jgi:hypothetical protein
MPPGWVSPGCPLARHAWRRAHASRRQQPLGAHWKLKWMLHSAHAPGAAGGARAQGRQTVSAVGAGRGEARRSKPGPASGKGGEVLAGMPFRVRGARRLPV